MLTVKKTIQYFYNQTILDKDVGTELNYKNSRVISPGCTIVPEFA